MCRIKGHKNPNDFYDMLIYSYWFPPHAENTHNENLEFVLKKGAV